MDEAWRDGTHLVALFNIRSGRSTKRQTSLLDFKTVQLKAENNQVYLSFIFCYPLWRVLRHLAEWHLVEWHSSESPVTI
jgi:hypothetical protein